MRLKWKNYQHDIVSIKVLDLHADPAFPRDGRVEKVKWLHSGKGIAPNTHKYLDQFLRILLATFTTGLVFVKQSKQG